MRNVSPVLLFTTNNLTYELISGIPFFKLCFENMSLGWFRQTRKSWNYGQMSHISFWFMLLMLTYWMETLVYIL